MSRRRSQPFNLSLLDLLTSALGAVIFLFIITPKGGAPATQTRQVGVYIDTAQQQVFGLLPDSLHGKQVGDTLLAVLVDYRNMPQEQTQAKRIRKEPKTSTPKPVPSSGARKMPDRAKEVKSTPKPESSKPEEKPKATAAKPATQPVSPPPDYKGDAPSVPCRVSFEINWEDQEDNVDLFVCRDGSCVYGGRKRDRNIGQWDSGKSRNRLFGNDLRTNQEAVRQFDELLPGEYELYAQFKNSRRESQSVRINGLIYTQNDAGHERGSAFTQTLTLGEERVLLGKVILREDGTFNFSKP